MLLRPDAVLGANVDEELQHRSFDLRREGGGQVRALYLRFSPAPGVRVLAVVCRTEASINLLQEMIARRVQPVLARYLRLWWWHRTERRRAALLERALEFTDLGVVLLDATGRIIHANAWAKTLLERGDGLRIANGRVEAVSAEDATRLQGALRGALGGMAQVPLVSVRRVAKRALLVCVMGETRRALDPRDAAALLYVVDPDHDLRSLLSPACRLYGLTGSEARLVAHLVSGADLSASAQQMNVGVSTARSYLKQVFAKTSTNRQADLVRVMIGSAARAPAMMATV
ncbi:helix-turn-helix transcriptional regulator [bacterium]|nr:MAG: helix-turn-helix transcriptional regulator [bacterium]